MGEVAYIALGSNLGDRDAHLEFARRELAALPGVSTMSDLSMSSINTVNGTTTISGTLSTGSGAVPFSLEIVSTGDAHKIQAITVGGQTLR